MHSAGPVPVEGTIGSYAGRPLYFPHKFGKLSLYERFVTVAVPTPIYTSANCRSAYQLNWSLALFWHAPVQDADWLAELQATVEPDGVRILEHRFARPGVSQFLLSTRPAVSPHRIVWSVKGRLQHLVQCKYPRAFRRNYGLHSLGSATREAVERYVSSQVEHHPMADPRVQQVLRDIQINNAGVDLATPRANAHALFCYNLHVCFVADGRCREVRPEPLRQMRDMIVKAAAKKTHLLCRAAIVPDHIHRALGCNVGESPAEISLSYMNNLAYAWGSKRVFSFGFYLGTFGEYDLGATRL
jgi:REP element-mobilizing transposase RayT